jgi:hypothetical protein
VAHNTPYDNNIKNAYVSYVNENINIRRYLPQDIVSMDAMNFDFDQESGETLTNRGNGMSGQSVAGSVNHRTVLLDVKMSGQNCHLTLSLRGKIQEVAECGKSSRQLMQGPSLAALRRCSTPYSQMSGWMRSALLIGLLGCGRPLLLDLWSLTMYPK